MYKDGYAHKYQQINGFKVFVWGKNGKKRMAYLSLEPSTRSTYDIAMRDSTINGLITMDEIEELKPSQIFYKENNPNELYIIQSSNEYEFQKNTRNINAIKQNSYVTLKRKEFDDEEGDEIFKTIYEDIISFVSMQNKEGKNFNAGIEEATNINIQIPKRDIDEKVYNVLIEDRLILTNIEKDIQKEVKIESIDAFGVPGVIRIFGTFETRSGD